MIPKFQDYLNTTLAFYTLLSGPIWRYEQHLASIQASNKLDKLTNSMCYDIISRILNGLIKILIVAPLLLSAHNFLLNFLVKYTSYTEFSSWFFKKITGIFLNINFLPFETIYQFLSLNMIQYCLWVTIIFITSFSYFLYIYCNFSAYMDMVIPIARLLGLKMPENFNRPLECKDFLDLWSRWHITLSDWFKYYLFNPFLKFLIKIAGKFFHVEYLGCIAYFFVFFIMGIWHGTTTKFIWYGIALGGMASLTKLFTMVLSKKLGKMRMKNLNSTHLYMYFLRSTALLGLTYPLCLWWMPDELIRNCLGLNSLALIILGIIVAMIIQYIITFFIQLYDKFLKNIKLFKSITLRMKKTNKVSFFSLNVFWSAIKMFIIISFLMISETVAPNFVYQGF